jgi:MFS family permease
VTETAEMPADPSPARPRELTPAESALGRRMVMWASVVGVMYSYTVEGSGLTLFARKLEAPETVVGLLRALLQMAVVLQVLLAREVETRGKKRLQTWSWIVMAVLILPLMALPYLGVSRDLQLGILVATVALSAVLRQPGSAAWMPLLSDVIPQDLRGRFFGWLRTGWQSAGLAVTVFVALLFGKEAAWWQFEVAFGIGLVSCLWRIRFMRRIPELPPHPAAARRPWSSFILEVLHDRPFMRFIALVGCISSAVAFMGPFSVVYMRDRLHYRDDFIMFADQGLPIAGAILTLILWGHLADRIGNRAIFFFTTAGTALTLLVWLAVREGSVAGQVALAASIFVRGALQAGFGIATARFLYGVLPTGNKTGYTSLHTVTIGLTAGLSPLIGGFILNQTEALTVQFPGFTLDNYQLLFGLTALASLPPLLLLPRIRTAGDAPSLEFVNFLLARPFRTARDIFLYHRPLDEARRAEVTRRLADSSTVVTVHELLHGLTDPSYLVREAAARGLAVHRRPEVVRALLAKLDECDALILPSVIWALGELEAPEAARSLAEALASPDAHVRAQAALALGKLAATEAVPSLRRAWRDERNPVVAPLIAGALSRLGDDSFIPDAVHRLGPDMPPMARRQLATAIADLLPLEGDFYELLRRESAQHGAAVRRLLRPFLAAPEGGIPVPATDAAALTGVARALAPSFLVPASPVRTTARRLWHAYSRRRYDVVVETVVEALGAWATAPSKAAATDSNQNSHPGFIANLIAAHRRRTAPPTEEETLLFLVAFCTLARGSLPAWEVNEAEGASSHDPD